MEAEIFSPARQRQVVFLQPLPATGEGGLLRFEGRYRPRAQGGYYVVMARAVGRSGNIAFERGEQAVFGVRGDGASLSGVLELRAVPPAASKQRGLEAMVGIQVKREGDYLCSVTLLDGQERRSSLGHTPRTCSLATQSCASTFPVPR